MYWSRKRGAVQDEKDQVSVPVWECEAEGCLGWMRKEFSLSEEPKCPLCETKMKSSERLLYVLKS